MEAIGAKTGDVDATPNKGKARSLLTLRWVPSSSDRVAEKPLPNEIGIGEQVHFGIGRIIEFQIAEVGGRQVRVREERNRATGGQAAELDEGHVNLRTRGVKSVGARVTGHLHADIGAQHAVGGGGPCVDVDAAAGTETYRVLRTVDRFDIEVLGADTAADAQAGFGAGNVEEAVAMGGADPDILDCGSLCRRQVSCLNTSADNRHGTKQQ